MPAPEQGHLASCTLPHSFFSPESGLFTCGCATPAPCSGMGQVEASPYRGCCQENMRTCAQVSVALEGGRQALSVSPGSGKPLGSKYSHLLSCATWQAPSGSAAVLPVGEQGVGWRGQLSKLCWCSPGCIHVWRWPPWDVLRAHPLPLAMGCICIQELTVYFLVCHS